ncbi:MAG: hypothetical protein WBQ38_12540 [Ignavibacteria bacterium]|nr:hypothetical protein [Ignavibacteria bacterium]MBK8381497.1 hypothetical protein [Ignavibacteria bacterium]MBL0108369.1 hypothetical protein [Ignavibacteria bacterium]
MKENKLQSLLTELKTKVKDSSGKIGEGELLNMINLIAKSEMLLRHKSNSCPEEFEKEILKLIRKK